MKKALIFDPYLDTLGGGERYCLTFALGLLSAGYSVEIAWNDKNTLEMAQERFGLDLSSLKLNRRAFEIFQGKSSIVKRFFFTIKYGLIFWVSDGSLPLLFSRNNLVHFQVPFKTIGGNPIINRIKTLFVHKFVYNSKFTAAVHETHFPKEKSYVLYPPIDVASFHPEKKENIILSVARFDSPSHPKRQDILLDAFKILNRTHPEYQMFLAGGSHGTSNTLEELKTKAGSLPVKFIVDPDFTKLKSLYSKSRFFWHAAGFGIDEQIDPGRVEHFGMTTVEAMSAGCIPVVIGKGGQKEIITAGMGFLCDTAEEIAADTLSLIKDQKKEENYSQKAIDRSKQYSIASFNLKLKNIL